MDRTTDQAPLRPSRVLITLSSAGLLCLIAAVVTAAASPGAWPWPVVALLWAAFMGLRADAAQRRMWGADRGGRTARRVLFGQLLGSLALVACALPALVPVACLLVASVHAEWRWRRALEAGSLGGLVLSALAALGVHAGVLPAERGVVEQVAAVGLASLVLTNVAILARQREHAAAALLLAQRTRHDELLHAARHDALTGLLGRRGTAEELEAACAAAAPGGLAAVVFCDLDGFKPVNDAHGHEVGDRLLVAVGRRLLEAAGTTGSVGRTGGDEFAVVVRGAPDLAALEELASRVRGCLDAPLVVDGTALPVGVSTGLAWTDAPVPGGELLRRADERMYAEKGAGRRRSAVPVR